MATLLLEAAVRAVLVAAGTAFTLWALRIGTAALRHAAWTTVVITMLLLPIWSAAGPKVPLAVLPANAASLNLGPDANPDPRNAAPKPAVTQAGPAPFAATARPAGEISLIAVYLLGACVLLARLAIGTVQARRLRRGAVIHRGRATSARCATPVTIGWLSPVLILPEGWERWSAEHLAAVLTHEHEHSRRHDPLVQWLALLNRAIFWFHPLAWWLERRLANLAEEACDAAVIRAGHSPQDYSDYLIDMARALRRQGRRLNVAGMAMPGSNLPQRIRRLFEEGPMKPLSPTRVIFTLAFCATSAIILAAGTLVPRPVPMSGVQSEPPARVNATDFTGSWSLVSATSRGVRGGNTGGGWSLNDPEVKVTSKWVSGAPVNCGPECAITQDAKTVTISRLGTPDAVTNYDNGVVALNLDGSDSVVTYSSGRSYVVHANWEGEKVVVTYHTPWNFTVTQVLSIADGRLKVVTDMGVGFAPVTFTYLKQ
jgi:beta-lactamase regulating signal transducer with metallopeptidase domain